MFKRSLILIVTLVLTGVPALAQADKAPDSPSTRDAHSGPTKLDSPLRARAQSGRGTSRVIIETSDVSATDRLIRSLKGTPGRRLGLLRSQVAMIPNGALETLASRPGVTAVRLDRPVQGTMERTSATIGAKWVRETLGFDGAGVGVAIIDSGVTAWHDDLGSDRVTHFADFVDFQPQPYDDYGHGTHVAGIIAGSGYDSNGARRGIAPAANLVVLKVLDGEGFGYISNVIAALDYAVEHRAAVQHPRHQPVGCRRRVRVVHDRSADACGQACGRSGGRRRHRGRESGPQRSGAAAVWRHHRARQCAVGAYRRGVEPQRHGEPRG